MKPFNKINLREYIEVAIKHLPPAASEMQVLDIGGVYNEILPELRQDVVVTVASMIPAHWEYEGESFDAVVAHDILLSEALLSAVLKIMRPGGRFIVINPHNEVDQHYVTDLENAGYVRILIEPALYPKIGVLIRGEKVHQTQNTLARVEQVASKDSDTLTLDDFKGRYIHLLIRQSPNKPVWKFAPDEMIEWFAAGIERAGEIHLLAFSSLPKAVNFMQSAVMRDFIRDINKVGKFSKTTAQMWIQPILLNPMLDDVINDVVSEISIDPQTAETPDE